jgi:hypothetical protein
MMTTSVFDTSIRIASAIDNIFSITGDLEHTEVNPQLGIEDKIYTSMFYRRGHISIINAREKSSVWMLHVTVFPHVNDDAPIYGFDIVAGPNKVSGAFHDFSRGGDPNHHLMNWFREKTKDLGWHKRRELPEWAKNIFSESIVAIGAVGTDELQKFAALGVDTLNYYVDHVGDISDINNDFTERQNYYCKNQRLNPHTPRVLVNLGFTQEQATSFVENNLFPLI